MDRNEDSGSKTGESSDRIVDSFIKLDNDINMAL